ncbi:Protein CBG22866 [Caenorhabditis briggsae]|uniref:Protein CBG22866 n=1 Tax=Caenorhabditis briggsae TaxID=6238 RepID=A8Y390_CAEBR|nr:Protein CBG22866 [Caenorhabditis briggsae]CAP39359.1 Protein CBG22866 [Caenorhabditis briggsae]
MFPSLIVLSVLAITVLAAPATKPIAEESRAELLSFGISPQAADGLIRIGTEAKQSAVKPDGATQSPLEVIGATFKLLADMDAFMKTQSPEDQAAAKKMFETKKAEDDAKWREFMQNGGK